jgi:hypothetical protein
MPSVNVASHVCGCDEDHPHHNQLASQQATHPVIIIMMIIMTAMIRSR